MSALKIVYLAGDKQIVLYGQGMKQMWQVETHVLERLGKDERLKLENCQFRKFWIDEEGDRVEIMNDVDFEFFLRCVGANHRTPKIFFEALSAAATNQPKSSTSSPDRDTENLTVHRAIECDVCKTTPVRGFRYKCMECKDFDLCMKCEGEMKHPEHMMLRIPNSDVAQCGSVYNGMATIFSKKRHQRKQAAAATSSGNGVPTATAYAEGLHGDGKSRHHRHHRRHCSAGPGIWTHLYDMMQDLAEGGAAVPQQTTATTETPVPPQQQQGLHATPSAQSKTQATTAAAPTANSQSKETNTSPDRSFAEQQSTDGVPTVPSFENLQNMIDPNFMKAGIQILNNFSEMFGKILDPIPPTSDGSQSRSDSSSESVLIDIDLTNGNSRSSTTTPPPSATPKVAAAAQEISAANTAIVTPMETEVSPATPPATAAESQQRSRNSQSEENDWTMIDNNVATSTTAEVPASAAAAAAAVVAASAPRLDFAMLSQQLQSHIANEMREKEKTQTPVAPAAESIPTTAIPTPVVTSAPVAPPAPVPTPRAPDVTENRAVAVFHPDPRINSAVHAMMAMGFSNEGASLTQLLESVNGSIPLALDLMSAAQR